MKNNERKEQSLAFQEQWKLYTTLYWNRIYSSIQNLFFSRPIFPKESILLWGWIPYTLYKSSSFYNSNPIDVSNQDLNVYYYVREIKSIMNTFSRDRLDTGGSLRATSDQSLLGPGLPSTTCCGGLKSSSREDQSLGLKFFAFVNVIGVKDLVQMSNDEDHMFLKNLYDTKLGIHSIFDHEYKDHCWDSLTKENIE